MKQVRKCFSLAIPNPTSCNTAVTYHGNVKHTSNVRFFLHIWNVQKEMEVTKEEIAKKLALGGHSLFILGQCGTGKTYILR